MVAHRLQRLRRPLARECQGERRLAVLVESLAPLLEGVREVSAHLHHALPLLSFRLARLERLLQPCDEAALLWAFLEHHKEVSVGGADAAAAAPGGSALPFSAWHAVLDMAAWLVHRARQVAFGDDSLRGSMPHGERERGADGFEYD
eukprot:978070-Prymnesium_polylepis.1